MIRTARRPSAFSLIELVIVVVIIGIIAAIAIPRMSKGAQGANESTLAGNLAVLRKAIDLYSSEHEGRFPTVAAFNAQMTTYTDVTGATSATKTGAYVFGPYLRGIPALNVGLTSLRTTTVAAAAGAGVAWVYDETNGTIKAGTAGTGTGADVQDSNSKYWNAY
jgi:general secretion pathway protein G